MKNYNFIYIIIINIILFTFGLDGANGKTREYIHGQNIHKNDIDWLLDNKLYKREIIEKIGPPTIILNNVFYYIKIIRYNSKLKLHKEYESNVLRIKFNKNDMIQSVNIYSSPIQKIKDINNDQTFFENNLYNKTIREELSYLDFSIQN